LTSEADVPAPAPSSGQLSRPLSGLEFACGAAVVIGHNVLHILPNEVPILFVAALVSTRLREGGWATLGLRRPRSWRRTALIAVATVAVLTVVSEFVIVPLTTHFWPPEKAPAGADLIRHSYLGAAAGLAVVWTFAAFGEEVSYRGYLTKRAADVGGGGRVSWWVATVLVAVLFGYGHYYKGPAGVLDSATSGLILGAAYLLSGRNLWVTILAHGLHDTLAVTAAFFGWDF
jgi:membrane protease YdiL (CAAX protease family)